MTDVKSAEQLVEAIDRGFDEADDRGKPRQYIGASIIGNQCDAYITMCMRGFPEDPPPAFLKRIFNLGHILEDEIVKDLKRRADVRVWEVDGITGKQHTYDAWGGHVVCHTDGHIELDDDVLRILEIKSMNDNSFGKFVDKGVKVSHPHYFAQVQMMMGMSGFDETVFIAMNKNNCRYHAEIVEFDAFSFAHIKQRIERALSGEPGVRISETPDDWRCEGCFKRSACWGKVDPPVSCATCKHSVPREDGGWQCHKHDREAIDPCASYEKYQPRAKEPRRST